MDITQEERYRLPVLKTRNGDLSKRWYVEYYAWQKSLNNGQGGLVRRLFYCPAKHKTAVDRKRWSKDVIRRIKQLFDDGFYIVDESSNDKAATDVNAPSAPPRPLTFLEAVDSMVKIRESGAYRPRTGETYRNAYRRFADFLSSVGQTSLLLENITTKHIYQFSDYIIQERKLSSRYRNNLIEDLSTLFKDLVEREYLVKNPAAPLPDLPVQASRRNLAFTPVQREELEQYLQKHDGKLYAFTRFIYQSFLRPIELTRLQVRDIDFEQNRIICHSSVAKGGSKKQYTEYIALTNSMLALLENMNLGKYPGTHYLFGYDLEPSRLPEVRNRISARHQKALIGAGLYNGELTMYSWKHTGVVNAWKAGASIEWLQRHLRHSDLKDTVVYLKSLGLSLGATADTPTW